MASTHNEVAGDALPRLLPEHPALFAGRTFDIPSNLPAGWFPIADRLCDDIEAILGDRASRFHPIQSKEKFGSWRFYWRLEAAPGEDQEAHDSPLIADIAGVVEGSGVAEERDVETSSTPAGVRISILPAGDVRRAVHARVRQAEQETERTCMWCGQAGTYWTTGWVHVACNEHRRTNAVTLDEWRRRAESLRQKGHGGRGKPTKGEENSDDN